MQPWQTIERIETREGPLELRRRGERSFLITIAGRVLMTSVAHQSEAALAQLACAALGKQSAPHVMIGGLGMGYTLRAALDCLAPSAKVTVVELNRQVVAWCQGPLGALTGDAIADPRVAVQIDDVSRAIATAPAGSYDAIVLDLYEGPHHATRAAAGRFYGMAALSRAAAALRPGGTLAIWSEDPDGPFEERFTDVGFTVQRHRLSAGGRAHIVYIGVWPGQRLGEGRRSPDGPRPDRNGRSRDGQRGRPPGPRGRGAVGHGADRAGRSSGLPGGSRLDQRDKERSPRH